MIRLLLRTLSLAIGIGCLSLPATGQKPKVFPDYTYVYEPSDSMQMTIFDYAQYRAYYEKQYRDDPSTPSAYHWMQVLQIGKSYQAFLDYGALRSDSIWNASVKARKKYGEFEAEDKAASRATLSGLKLIFDRSKGMINAHDAIFLSKYHYTEPIPQLQWTMARGAIARSWATHATRPRRASAGETTSLGTPRRSPSPMGPLSSVDSLASSPASTTPSASISIRL